MRVENENDRMEEPEECDWCRTTAGGLTRHAHYGPGYQVDWLCKYCENGYGHSGNTTIASMAAMFNVLEKRIKKLDDRLYKLAVGNLAAQHRAAKENQRLRDALSKEGKDDDQTS